MPKYFMGIDNGGTLSKAVIFDAGGKEIASAFTDIELITPKAGFTERDMCVLWDANCRVIKEAIEKSGLDPKDIKGVSCTGHGKGLYLWGKDEKPCYNGIVSTDTRAWEYPEKWKRDGTAEKAYEKTYQRVVASQPVCLLSWLKDNQNDVIPNIKWIFAVKDYIRFRLTGEAYAELTDYSGSNLLNLKEKRFDKELLELFGLGELWDAIPPLKESTDICGYITEEASAKTGLAKGTPVAAGMFDIDACAIAMDITGEENIAVIAGTWSINEYISKAPVLHHPTVMNSFYCSGKHYLIEESSPTSAGNHSWFIKTFMGEEKIKAKESGKSVYAYCDEIASGVAPDEQNIVFLPYIYGSNYNSKAKASLIGLDSHHTRAHIIRAVMEGITFCHRVHLEKLLQCRKSTRAIRLSGGAAKSELWAQIFADVLKLPIEIIETDELGTLGCAIACAVASGEYSSVEEATAKMVKIKKRIEPNEKNFEAYDRKYELYKTVSEALDTYWKGF